MGGVVVSLQETRTSMPLHERVWRELSAEIRLKTPERWSAINQHMHTATTPYVAYRALDLQDKTPSRNSRSIDERLLEQYCEW